MNVNQTDGIWQVSSVLTAEECTRHVARTEAQGYMPATITTRKGAEVAPAIRDNDRVVLDDPVLALDLWRRLAAPLPRFLDGCQAIGLNERFRYYRYEPGQQFRGHTDAPFRRANGEESRLTVLIYLNEDFTGGETAFRNHEISARKGAALVFRHELFHEGRPVLTGTKYVLRTDVMFNPPGRFSG